MAHHYSLHCIFFFLMFLRHSSWEKGSFICDVYVVRNVLRHDEFPQTQEGKVLRNWVRYIVIHIPRVPIDWLLKKKINETSFTQHVFFIMSTSRRHRQYSWVETIWSESSLTRLQFILQPVPKEPKKTWRKQKTMESQPRRKLFCPCCILILSLPIPESSC